MRAKRGNVITGKGLAMYVILSWMAFLGYILIQSSKITNIAVQNASGGLLLGGSGLPLNDRVPFSPHADTRNAAVAANSDINRTVIMFFETSKRPELHKWNETHTAMSLLGYEKKELLLNPSESDLHDALENFADEKINERMPADPMTQLKAALPHQHETKAVPESKAAATSNSEANDLSMRPQLESKPQSDESHLKEVEQQVHNEVNLANNASDAPAFGDLNRERTELTNKKLNETREQPFFVNNGTGVQLAVQVGRKGIELAGNKNETQLQTETNTTNSGLQSAIEDKESEVQTSTIAGRQVSVNQTISTIITIDQLAEEVLPLGPYHQWGPEGIKFIDMLRFINHTYYEHRTLGSYTSKYGPFPMFLAKFNGTTALWGPHRVMFNRQIHTVHARLGMLLPFFQRAVQLQFPRNKKRFPFLTKALVDTQVIPVAFRIDDNIYCGNNNYNFSGINASVPLFVLSTPKDCNYSFPMPTYKTYEYMKLGEDDDGNNIWNLTMQQWDNDYPWWNKTSQVYWRGGCGDGQRGHRHEYLRRIWRKKFPDWIDARATTYYKCAKRMPPAAQGKVPMEYSMHYKAVFDIDGNAWSERFPRLLCYNSAVIKINVDPLFMENEEFFMPDLIPNYHYIPADMDNFTEVARIAMQNMTDEELQSIVRNANTWCRQRMTEENLNLSFLSVLDGYVENLYKGDDEWYLEWNQIQEKYVGLSSDSGHGEFLDHYGNGPGAAQRRRSRSLLDYEVSR